MASLSEFCDKWRLTPSVTKTVSSVFHLDNRRASQELNIYLSGRRISHDPHPVYLGVSLDRSLTFRQHATKTAAKIKSRNNLISKLAGSSWGADAQTLWSSAVALCYSVAEYCVPAWGHSSHVKLVDRQLNETMQIVSGTIRPTPLQWLPVLSHIAPPVVRRTELSANFIHNFQKNLMFLSTRTSSTIQCLVCHPAGQYGPSTHLLPQTTSGELLGRPILQPAPRSSMTQLFMCLVPTCPDGSGAF